MSKRPTHRIVKDPCVPRAEGGSVFVGGVHLEPIPRCEESAMDHPLIPDSPWFRNDRGLEMFLCGDGEWAAINGLHAEDANRGTHFAKGCADAARAAWLDKEARLNTEAMEAYYMEGGQTGDLADARNLWADAQQACDNASTWTAWGKEG